VIGEEPADGSEPMRHHLAALIAAIAASTLVGACAAPASSPAGPATAPSPASSAAPPTASRPATLGFEGRDAVVVVGRPGDALLTALVASTGEQLVQLPVAVPATPDWGYLATTTISGAQTIVAEVGIGPAGGGSTTKVDGAWRLPTIGYDPTPVGLSADGSTLVLVDAGKGADAPDRTTTRFAIVPYPPGRAAPQVLELPGALDYDTISPNGKLLYVVRHVGDAGSGSYEVHAVDLPSGVMQGPPIVDKRNIDETMAGWPIAQLRDAHGLVLTLYRGLDHPFVHALQSAEAWAICIDLPAGGDATSDLDWGLAASADGRSLFAVNATRGLAVDIDPSELSARRTVTIKTATGPTFDLAKFGDTVGGPVGRRVVVSPDGSAVFAAGTSGVLRLKHDLTVDTTLLEGTAVSSIGLLPDGRTLYALVGDGRVVAVDAATGALVGELPGTGYDRLVAVVPWR
jgi:hypothetical protein